MTPDHKTVREALEAIDNCYDMLGDFIGNGCEHGFKPAKSCPNKGCIKADAQRGYEALAALDRIEAVETVTVDEYAERMRGAVVLDGQYSYCYGRDTAKVFPNGLRIVQAARQPEQPAAPINQAYEG